MVTIPTALDLDEGAEALFFLGASFLGLRVSLFDFIWPFAIGISSVARHVPIKGLRRFCQAFRLYSLSREQFGCFR
jgi:hypothetical protein